MNPLKFQVISCNQPAPLNEKAVRRLQTSCMDDLIRECNPKEITKKTAVPLKIAGVNVINRKDLESDVAIDRIQRKRERHNRVERNRRYRINQAMDQLATLIPASESTSSSDDVSHNHSTNRSSLIHDAVNYILALQKENATLKLAISSTRP
ncbi:hypothetical protein DSO57_1022137 [Entomophthora muscae]|uniref:Uncharacterized protein n=1 Tax=Entomophthora muscae TaxID=34485 RepID=A0ACC2UCU8_9FUNG|nr:hypothetical protein DSO57_1022137 [Entomophthora muscae]